MCSVVDTFRSTVSVHSQPTPVHRRNARSANIATTRESVQEMQSILYCSQEVGLSQTTIWRILHRYKLRCYRSMIANFFGLSWMIWTLKTCGFNRLALRTNYTSDLRAWSSYEHEGDVNWLPISYLDLVILFLVGFF